MTFISGVVTGFRERADVTVSQSVPNQAQLTVKRSANFRIGNRAVFMDTAPNLIDGDLVSAVGKETSAEFKVLAVRNETTQMMYWEPFYPNWVVMGMIAAPLWFLVLCFMSVPAGLVCAFLIGPLFTLGGVWHLFSSMPTKAALALLRATPKAAAVTQAG